MKHANLWTDSYYNELLKQLEEILQANQRDIIAVICRRIKEIGDMNPTSAKQIARLVKYQNADLKEIQRIIKRTTNLTQAEINRLFRQAAKDSNEYAQMLTDLAGGVENSVNVAQLARIMASTYNGELINLSQTLGFKTDGQLLTIRQQYVKAIDRAVTAISTGTTDYNTAIRSTVRQMADSGVREINWESGYSRRADSSIRMNVLDGVRNVNQTVLNEATENYATGYEISAHDLPAPDHEDIQGRQYTTEEYELLNASLKRPIGTLNCMHFAFPIVYGVSVPAYSEAELQDMKNKAHKEHTWLGKKYTGYECTQKQRAYELAIRKHKERRDALQTAGDTTGAREEQRTISALNREYKDFSEHVGLRPQMERTRIASVQPAFTKQIEMPGNMETATEIPDDIKESIITETNEFLAQYNIRIDNVVYTDISGEGKTPLQFTPKRVNGNVEMNFTINSGFNWNANLDEFNSRIYNNYAKGRLASKNLKDLIAHEMAHFMSFQRCITWKDFTKAERILRNKFVKGVSGYADGTLDGAESLAEAFVKYLNGEAIPKEAEQLIIDYIMGWVK